MFFGEMSAGKESYLTKDAASTLNASFAIAVFSASSCFLVSSSKGSIFPSFQMDVQRAIISSGAPLVYCTTPLSVWCSVDIIFLMLSKGASAIRGVAFSRLSLGRSCSKAKLTKAHSVGSPTAFPSERVASLHSAIAVASSFSSKE
ncbi:unknown [Corallococcus sp. CAG:1435]|nr:unknown [Corallococcus sp. CAG:1435]